MALTWWRRPCRVRRTCAPKRSTRGAPAARLRLEPLEDRLVPSPVLSALTVFNTVNGEYPDGGVLLDSSGNLFGTTANGGDALAGTIFEWNKAAGTLTTLASFNRADGEGPTGDLVEDASGNLYGTTAVGGTHRQGTLFEWNRATGTITVLFSFQGAAGSNPGGLVEDASGNLFGTTSSGGAHGDGTIFEWVQSTHTLTVLAPFTRATGKYADDLLLDPAGNLFGATGQGGAAGTGTVFEWSKSTGTLSVLASFDASEGTYHYGALVEDTSGNLFGTSYTGGTGSGSIYELANGSHTITDIAVFDGTNDYLPYGGLVIDGAGNLYGTTDEGGSYAAGSVFEWVKSTGTVTDLAYFNGANGSQPQTGLAIDRDGNLFGTTAASRTDGTGAGMVFEWVKSTGTIAHLGSFDGALGGSGGNLIADASGNLFGTLSGGGAQGDGEIYEWAQSTGTLSVVASFNGVNGKSPNDLVEDASGNLFGTTNEGGSAGAGTLFEWVKSTGTITVLASFDAFGPGGLVLDADGNLFGTTSYGGDQNRGTLFEWDHQSGTMTVLTSFTGPNGAYPGGLITDADGNLFGTTEQGGPAGAGTIFEWVKATGTLSTLASFTGADGQSPNDVIADASGNLYGTTYGTNVVGPAPYKYGNIFEWVKSTGTITVLGAFNGRTAAWPHAGLVADAGGNLYGTTTNGGPYNVGAVFEWVKSSRKTVILGVFNNHNGQEPITGLVLDANGNLFGTTSMGGGPHIFGSGTLFEYANVTPQPATLPTGTLGSSYGPVTIQATGGSGTYVFSVARGSKLPPGLTLSPDGVLSGTPTRRGSFAFVLVATDADNPSFTGKLRYTLRVN